MDVAPRHLLTNDPLEPADETRNQPKKSLMCRVPRSTAENRAFGRYLHSRTRRRNAEGFNLTPDMFSGFAPLTAYTAADSELHQV